MLSLIKVLITLGIFKNNATQTEDSEELSTSLETQILTSKNSDDDGRKRVSARPETRPSHQKYRQSKISFLTMERFTVFLQSVNKGSKIYESRLSLHVARSVRLTLPSGFRLWATKV